MKHLFIMNPAAGGNKKNGRQLAAEIEAVMQARADDYEIYWTKAPMDACRKIEEESEKCEKLRVYACGGDGTLNECVNGAAGKKNTAVTHFPRGTGNDFIRMFGEEAALFSDLNKLVDGEERPIDLIRCNGRYSANICSVGIDARVGADVHKYSGIPVIGGAGGYIVSLIVNVLKGISQRYTIKTERESREDEFSLVCVCNGRYYGGGFNPVPEARPDDGILEILIVEKVSRLKVAQLIGRYAKGRYKEFPELIRHIRGERISIESREEIVVNIDGEAIYSKKVDMEIVKNGVQFLFPKHMAFFNSETEKTEENTTKQEI